MQRISCRLRIAGQRSLHLAWVAPTLGPLKLLGLDLGLDQCSQEVVVVLVQQGLAELGVFNHQLLGKVVELILAVEE